MMKKSYLVILVCLLCLFLAGCGNKGQADNKEGLSLYENGQYMEALAAFGKAIQADGSNGEYYLNKGMTELALADYDEARTALMEALRLKPEEPAVFRAMGIVYLEEGNYSEALTYFTSALNAAGKKKSDLRTDICLYKAEAELRSGDYTAAAATYGELIGGDEKNADLYLLRGRALLSAGDKEGAKTDFTKAAGLSGQGGEELSYISYQTALSFMEQGDYEQALGEIEEGLSGAGEESRKQFLYAEAACYEYLGDFRTALNKFTAYRDTYGSDEAVEHEITFLSSRVQ